MRIITLSGVDGCGKSTQAQKLIADLSAHGKNVFHFHAVSFSIANTLLGSMKKKGTMQKSARAITHANIWQRFLRVIALLIDLVRFRLLLISLWWDGIDYVISDRYFYDTAINIAYLSPSSSFPLVMHLIPRPYRAFFLNITPDAILLRARVPEQGLPYLRKKNDLFHKKLSAWHMIMIDADRSEDMVFEDLAKKIS